MEYLVFRNHKSSGQSKYKVISLGRKIEMTQESLLTWLIFANWKMSHSVIKHIGLV